MASEARAQSPLLETRQLTKYFYSSGGLLKGRKRAVRAVDGIDLAIREGETFGLVGESGCGKSTLGRTILRLIEPTGGSVLYRGQPIEALGREELRLLKRKMQIVFQDPYACLNPRMTVLDLVKAPLDVFGIGTGEERVAKVVDMLEYVGLGGQHLNRYPHEFSGGQRQRIGIARALVLEPEFIMCDEPVSALDVSVRAQVLNLMGRIQAERGLTYLFISHDLSVVRHISDRIGVMYLGRLVEVAGKDELYRRPLHPYTKALLSAIPIPDPEVKRERVLLKGDVSSAYDPPAGCRFAARCPYATDRCRNETPALRELAPGHQAACVRAEELA
ncbi:ABC transporter ATP-binding protein [Allofournierella sp.]|uniref:ABC transporter ATP-binding protein n=1 Tax=Allofournierella sp. TaxID=1940256 RepID=UPI003AB62163